MAYEAEVADAVYPYAKWAVIGLIAGRALLMLLSLKWLPITKSYFYYELLAIIVDQCFPQDVNT